MRIIETKIEKFLKNLKYSNTTFNVISSLTIVIKNYLFYII